MTDSNLLITRGLAGIHIVNAAGPVHFATHLSDRWRNVAIVQIMPLEPFLLEIQPYQHVPMPCATLSSPVRERDATTPLEPPSGPARVV